MTDASEDGRCPLSVIIKCRHDPRILACLDSVPRGIEVLVMMAAADPMWKFVSSRTDVRCIDVGTEDLGVKCNRGIDEATNDLILLVDSDCVFDPGAIESVTKALHRHPIVRCRTVFDPGTSMLRRATALWREVENNREPVPAYCPGLGIDRRIRDVLGPKLFPEGTGFAEDAGFDELRKRESLPAHYLPDAVVRHDSIGTGHFIRSGYRTGYGTARQTLSGRRENFERVLWVVTRALRGKFVGWIVKRHRETGSVGLIVGISWLGAYRLGYHIEWLKAHTPCTHWIHRTRQG